MATLSRTTRKLLKNVRISPVSTRNITNLSRKNNYRTVLTCACVVGGGVAVYAANRYHEGASKVYALKAKPDELAKSVKLTSRERRFIKFSSVEYGGQLYMTPQDFLESVVEQEPRPRLKRRVLTPKEIEHLRDNTPPLKKGTPQMFRNLRDKGIISYTEYLFLLSILTKPTSGFQIAFNMFDTDGNQRVDKNEFLVIQRLLGGSLKERKDLDPKSEEAMEKIFSFAWKGKRGLTETDDPKEGAEETRPHENYVNDDQGLQRRHNVDTFLQVHFFGKKGTSDLKFEGFKRFMENLQTEVLELEFQEFAKGHETITEVDFAKILLRYTYLDTDEYDMFLDRLLDRVKDEKGITFDEFKTFCQFLNNLEDFTIAMRMYTLADHPISKGRCPRQYLPVMCFVRRRVPPRREDMHGRRPVAAPGDDGVRDIRRGRRRPAQLPGVHRHHEGPAASRLQVVSQERGLGSVQVMRQTRNEECCLDADIICKLADLILYLLSYVIPQKYLPGSKQVELYYVNMEKIYSNR